MLRTLSTTVLKLDLFNLGAISVEEIAPAPGSTTGNMLLQRTYSEYMTFSALTTCN